MVVSSRSFRNKQLVSPVRSKSTSRRAGLRSYTTRCVTVQPTCQYCGYTCYPGEYCQNCGAYNC